jgi:ribokinase
MILPDSQYILHIPGANQLLTPEDIESTQDLWTAGKILLIQGEIPVSASIRAAQVAKRRGMVVICDPAPATVMTDQLLQLADILTPNSQELSMLCNSPTLSVEEQARQLWHRYPQLKALIVTLGSEGALLQTDSEMATRIAAPSVTTLDPTAAGDAFNGALAHSLAQGQSLYQAVELGCCAGALAASQKGSSISIASLTQILEMWGEVY